jgi:hypothetical protein
MKARGPYLYNLTLLVFLSTMLYGCIYHDVIPGPIDEGDNRFPPIETKNSIAVVALHSGATEKVTICCDGNPHKYEVSLDVLSDAAKVNLESVFRRQRLQVKDSADKILKIRVINVTSKLGWTINFLVTLNTQAGDATPKEYTGSQTVGHQFATNFAVTQALNEALAVMLRDTEIRNYLEK